MAGVQCQDLNTWKKNCDFWPFYSICQPLEIGLYEAIMEKKIYFVYLKFEITPLRKRWAGYVSSGSPTRSGMFSLLFKPACHVDVVNGSRHYQLSSSFFDRMRKIARFTGHERAVDRGIVSTSSGSRGRPSARRRPLIPAAPVVRRSFFI